MTTPTIAILQGPAHAQAASVAFASGVGAGNLLICALAVGNKNSVVTDTQGNRWNFVTRAGASVTDDVEIWWTLARRSGACTVFFGQGVNDSAVWEVSGANQVDAFGGDFSASLGTWDCGAAAINTKDPIELMVYIVAVFAGTVNAPGAGTWTTSSLGGTGTFTGTQITSTNWAATVNGTITGGATTEAAVCATFTFNGAKISPRGKFRPLAA